MAILLKPNEQGIAQRLLPQDLNARVGQQTVRSLLTDLVYCGPDASGDAIGIGIALPPGTRLTDAIRVLEAGDCSKPLQLAADRAFAAEGGRVAWTAAFRIRATWRPWIFSFSVDNSAIASGAHGQATPDLTAFKNQARPLLSFNTKDISIAVDANHTAVFSLAPKFESDRIAVRIVRDSTTADLSAWDNLESDAMQLPPGDVTNLIIAASLPVVSEVAQAATVTPQSVYRTASDDILISQIITGGATNQFDLTGRADDQPRGLAGVAHLTFDGDDLNLSQVKFSPDLESCNDIGCQARNVAKQAAAAITATALQSKFSGAPMRPVGPRNVISLEWGNRKTQLSVIIKKIHSTATALTLNANVLLGNVVQ